MAVYFVTSASAGAPSLTGQDGSVCTVWDWILNTTAGLTIAFTATNKRVYTMPDGSALRIHHAAATSGDARLCIVRPAESASGVDTLVDPYPTVAQTADTACNICVSNTANATTRPWYALVDTVNYCFYFLVETSSGGFIRQGYFWAGVSALQADNYAIVSYNRNNASSSDSTALFFQDFAQLTGAVSGRIRLKRTRDGTIKSTGGFLQPELGASGGSIANGPVYPDPDDSKLRMARVWANDIYGAASSVGASPEVNRLWLPRIWKPMHALATWASVAINSTFTYGAYNTQTGVTSDFRLFPIGTAAGGSGAIILEVQSGGWAAPTQL